MDERIRRLLFPQVRCLSCNEPREIDPGAPLCDRCIKELEALRLIKGICPLCLSPLRFGDPCEYCKRGGMHRLSSAYSPYRYHGVCQQLISRLKFEGCIRAAAPLVRDMADSLSGASFDLLVPVPLHPADLRERGFNQSEFLSKSLSDLTAIRCQNALIKVKRTKKQSSLSHKQREENVKDAYLCVQPLHGLRVLLVDDVRTTGYTARACAGELMLGGADEVSLLTAAVAGSYSKSSSSSSPLAL